MNDSTKTKKVKKTRNIDMWKQFDNEIANNNNNNNSLECIYRQSGEREVCDYCNNILSITEEGFFACPNPSCGILYKDIVDQGAVLKDLHMK